EPMLDAASAWADDPRALHDALPESLVRCLSIVAKFLPSGNEAGADTTAAGRDSPAAADLTARLACVVRAMTARDRGLGVEASLVLNMNEQGGHGVMEDGSFVRHSSERAVVPGCEKCEHQLEVGTSDELPHCLSLDADRARVVGSGEGCTCSFTLCPYDFSA